MEEEIRGLRELELAAIDDIKNINNIAAIHQIAADADKAKQVRTAAIHALRRLYVDYLETSKLRNLKPNEAATAKVNKWFRGQYDRFVQTMCDLIASDAEWSHALCIRTLMELVKWDVSLREDEAIAGIRFGLVTYRSLLTALLCGPREVDVDLLLLLKDEIFIYHDAAYFALHTIREVVEEVKADGAASLKNILDVLRVLTVPDAIEEENFLTPVGSKAIRSNDDDSSDEEEKASKASKAVKRKAPLLSSAAPKRARLAMNASIGFKLQSLDHFKEDFGQTWVLVLSLPFAAAEHKLILKHLPKYVMPSMANPLLLADYLTQSYELGGIAAILALESLFQLIVTHNLDYPNFFISLYRLCTVAVFNAKYHGKFLKLLNMCLRSVNMPAYLVAAFIKRLAGVALQCSAPVIQFCITQIQSLLRQHQQTMVLLHREDKGEEFDINEKDVEKANALSSSLWELEALEQHYLYDIAKATVVLRDSQSTNPMSLPVVMEGTMDQSYAGLIDEVLNKKKKLNVAMAYRKPTTLCGKTSVVGKLFG